MKPVLHTLPIVVLDVETSGLDPLVHETHEIAAAVYLTRDELLAGAPFATFHAYLALEVPDLADPKALEVGHYAPGRPGEAPPREGFARLADLFQRYGGRSAMICGWNVAFDRGFLEAGAKRAGVRLGMGYRSLDLFPLAWEVLGDRIASGSLAAVCEELGVSNDGAHTAIADVRRTVEVYRRLQAAK